MITHRAPSISFSLLLLSALASSAQAPRAGTPAVSRSADQCTAVTVANAAASAGTPNIQHDGTPLRGVPAPDISLGFKGIPRSAQPPLTASQRRILECRYRLPEANAEMPYTLFVPSGYRAGTATPLVMNLHGLNITPLQQMLFDGTTDSAERHGVIVVAPMGFSLSGWWGARPGPVVTTAAPKPATDALYTTGELSELDAMAVLGRIRARFTVDDARIFLMGHSMGGAGTYHLGGKHHEIWAGLAPLAAAGGIEDAVAAERFRALPTLLMHGEKDSIVPAVNSRRAVRALQSAGAPHLYLELPGLDHEFWIRRGAAHMEKVFQFFGLLSKRSNAGFITPDMAPPPGPRPGG